LQENDEVRKNVVAEGNCVVVDSTGEAKTKNGKPYNQIYCDVFSFSDGKLQEITTYLDTALSNEILSQN
jgi:ketosteroid isomerase-like protein